MLKDFETYIEGIEYPVHKQDILEIAEVNGAPHILIEMLRELREGEYTEEADVWSEIGAYEERLFIGRNDAHEEQDMFS